MKSHQIDGMKLYKGGPFLNFYSISSPYIHLIVFHLDVRNGPPYFWINFSRSSFFKFLLKDEIVRMKLYKCNISSYDISSWKLIGLIPQPFIIVTNQHQESICFLKLSQFSSSWKVRQIQNINFFKEKLKIGWNGKDEKVRM